MVDADPDVDDEYDGKAVPKDSIIFIGVWALHHDANHFESPDTFNPERYKDHSRLASYYAGASEYMKRDMSPSPSPLLLSRSLD